MTASLEQKSSGKHRAARGVDERPHSHTVSRERAGRVRRAIGKVLPFVVTAAVSTAGGIVAAEGLSAHSESHGGVPVAERVVALGQKTVDIYEQVLAGGLADVDNVQHSEDGKTIFVSEPTKNDGMLNLRLTSTRKANINGWLMPNPRNIQDLTVIKVNSKGSFTTDFTHTAEGWQVSSSSPSGHNKQIIRRADAGGSTVNTYELEMGEGMPAEPSRTASGTVAVDRFINKTVGVAEGVASKAATQLPEQQAQPQQDLPSSPVGTS